MTNEELIAEARGAFKATNASASRIRRLADALEASEARVKELEAERDAALVAVERVRAIHRQLPVVSTGFPPLATDCVSCINGCDAPCSTIQALDGAPEPEWEYAREYRDEAGYPTIRKARDITTPDGHRSDGSPYWNYQVLRRRKAGPWQPVESEGVDL